MGNTVGTVGPLVAPNDRGSPHMAWHQIDWKKAGRTGQSGRLRIFQGPRTQVNRLERHAGKLARAVLRGGDDGDTASLPDRPLLRRSRFRQRLILGVRPASATCGIWIAASHWGLQAGVYFHGAHVGSSVLLANRRRGRGCSHAVSAQSLGAPEEPCHPIPRVDSFII